MTEELATPKGRITFTHSPWPEGHATKKFDWTIELREDGLVWMQLHLESADYYAERDIDEDVDRASAWETPAVWSNYHACTLSSTKWHRGGFPACPAEEFTAEWLDGKTFKVDPNPEDLAHDDRSFHIYLLGHDSVGDHEITFTRVEETDLFDIAWRGKIALTYAGDDEFRYAFRASIRNVPMPTIA